MSLKELYENWAFTTPTVVNTQNTKKSPREAATVNDASKGVSVDFLPDTYQAEVRNRGYQNKIIELEADPTKTKGTFNTNTAFSMYSRFLNPSETRNYYNNNLVRYNSSLIHKYDAQGKNVNDKFSTSNEYVNSPGVLYNTNK